LSYSLNINVSMIDLNIENHDILQLQFVAVVKWSKVLKFGL